MSRTNKRAYTGAKRFDTSCRCHGGCSWCRENRLRRDKKYRNAADEQLREYRRAD